MTAMEMMPKEVSAQPASYTDAELTSRLNALGVAKGDCLFVHSSLRSLGKFVSRQGGDGPESLFDAFIETIGESGTLVVPTFNFAFCKGKPFDRQKTPSEKMGAFSEFVRRHPSALRSRHPFQPVSAVGACATEIADAQGRSAFSPGSAFDTMLKCECKILFLGVDFVETFAHVAEERANVPYRFWKTFTGDFIDRGQPNRISVEFFARKLDLVPEPRIDNDKLGRDLRERKIIASTSLGGGHVAICNARDLVDELTDRLVEDPSYALKQELQP
jgi:aminoglycoside 3-N-acetyltransferase